jgi:hypothetical protein
MNLRRARDSSGKKLGGLPELTRESNFEVQSKHGKVNRRVGAARALVVGDLQVDVVSNDSGENLKKRNWEEGFRLSRRNLAEPKEPGMRKKFKEATAELCQEFRNLSLENSVDYQNLESMMDDYGKMAQGNGIEQAPNPTHCGKFEQNFCQGYPSEFQKETVSENRYFGDQISIDGVGQGMGCEGLGLENFDGCGKYSAVNRELKGLHLDYVKRRGEKFALMNGEFGEN